MTTFIDFLLMASSESLQSQRLSVMEMEAGSKVAVLVMLQLLAEPLHRRDGSRFEDRITGN